MRNNDQKGMKINFYWRLFCRWQIFLFSMTFLPLWWMSFFLRRYGRDWWMISEGIYEVFENFWENSEFFLRKIYLTIYTGVKNLADYLYRTFLQFNILIQIPLKTSKQWYSQAFWGLGGGWCWFSIFLVIE